MNHTISHKQTCTMDTMIYPGETLMGENPNNVSYEYIFKIRIGIHHDHIHQTLLHMSIYIHIQAKYLSFHVGLVAVANPSTLKCASHRGTIIIITNMLESSCQIHGTHHGANTKPQASCRIQHLSLSPSHSPSSIDVMQIYPKPYTKSSVPPLLGQTLVITPSSNQRKQFMYKCAIIRELISSGK